MSIFAGRLIQLQGIDANSYATQARDARLRTVVLPAARGDITDANGVALATTVDTVAITADPKQTAPDAAQIAGIIAPRLGLDAATITTALQSPGKRFVYIAHQVDQSAWKKIRADLATAGLAGISSESDPKRIYPAGSVAAAMIGFVGTDIKGLTGRAGLEASLDNVLAGKNGHQTYEASSEGPALPLGDDSMQKPVAGQGVQLTIDADLQYIAQKAVADAVRKTGADSGDAIVLDVKTGQIMAMATAPTYDANKPLATPAKLRRDRPVTDTYEPGSVFKLFHRLRAARPGPGHADHEGGGARAPLPRRVPDQGLVLPRHHPADLRRRDRKIVQRGHDPGRRADEARDAGRLPDEVRYRPAVAGRSAR